MVNSTNRFVHHILLMEQIPENFRCGYVAIVGAPNAGKSTLMNAILGMKISIVTAKPQTTRKRVLGFHTGETHQMIFIDTPGLIKPKYVLQESMVNAAHAAIAEADACCYLVDAPRVLESGQAFPEGLFDLFRESGRPVIAVLNKVDIVRSKRELLPLMQRALEAYPFAEVIPISALEGDAVPELLAALEKLLPPGPPLYPVDMLSDQPERFFVSEIVREKIFEQFRQEVPYATEVYIAEYREEEERDYIAAEIIVERESQKRIIIGAQGAAIKRIGMAAREDIEHFLGRRVFLDLHVRIREGWRDNASWIRRFGY
ncbi:MAG: GTPase Era [Bacteroidota bacterium]|nr:GTPase Era [Bacteroidota bacterium]